jgi:hypothetical protein
MSKGIGNKKKFSAPPISTLMEYEFFVNFALTRFEIRRFLPTFEAKS